jgi:hypothetical protein
MPPPSPRLPPGHLPHLAPPPRRVPFSLRVRLLFGGFGTFAWIWMTMASGIGTVFLKESDLSSWYLFLGQVVTAPGESLGCSRTNASEGGGKGRSGTPIFQTRYRFEVDGVSREGASYAVGDCVEEGAVEVEFPAGRPDASRIVGMRRAAFGPDTAFVLVFPAVGLGLVWFSLKAGRRQVDLLRRGRLALGTLIGKEATRTSINKRPVMRLTFAFTTDAGVLQEASVKTHRPELLEDEPRERLFYDPQAPARAEAWDTLSASPEVDATGEFQPKGLLGTVAVLLPPLAAVAAHVLALTLG